MFGDDEFQFQKRWECLFVREPDRLCFWVHLKLERNLTWMMNGRLDKAPPDCSGGESQAKDLPICKKLGWLNPSNF